MIFERNQEESCPDASCSRMQISPTSLSWRDPSDTMAEELQQALIALEDPAKVLAACASVVDLAERAPTLLYHDLQRIIELLWPTFEHPRSESRDASLRGEGFSVARA